MSCAVRSQHLSSPQQVVMLGMLFRLHKVQHTLRPCHALYRKARLTALNHKSHLLQPCSTAELAARAACPAAAAK